MYPYGNYNYPHHYDLYAYRLTKDLETYIQDELQDSAYYAALEKMAPTPRAQSILREFSQDEAGHAQTFQQTYFMLTGRYYTPKPILPVQIDDYEDALKDRLIAETHDYKKYGDQYLKAPNQYLQNLFFNLRTSEAQHAMRIPILFEEEIED